MLCLYGSFIETGANEPLWQDNLVADNIMEAENNKPLEVEKKSYALLFFGLSVLLVLFSLWVIKWEFIDLRPWRDYQKRYLEMKIENLQANLNGLSNRTAGDEYKTKYKEMMDKLKEAKENYRNPEVQSECKRILEEMTRKEREFKKVFMEFQNTRGNYLEVEYLYYKHLDPEDKKRLSDLESKSTLLQQRYEAIQEEIDSLKTLFAEYGAPVERAEADVRSMKSEFETIENEIEKLKNQKVEIKQIFIEDMNKADRCISCHVGIDKESETSDSHPFSSHPGKYIFLDKHPIDNFGCTSCHLGEGRATSAVWKAHGEDKFWTEPMLHGFMAQATCQNCHGDVKRLKGADILTQGVELVERHGCYGCHQVAGFEDLRKIGFDLTYVGEKTNYSWLIQWIQQPKDYLPEARMSKFFFSESEAEEIADYLVSMAYDYRKDTPEAEVDWDRSDRGKILWRTSRCSICHVTNGLGGAHKQAYAPELSKIGSKVNREWLFNWLKEPEKYFPETKMPRFRLTDEEIEDLVEYIMGEFVDWDFEPRYLEPQKITNESIIKGKSLIQKYGCFGCHNVKGMEELKEIGPFLRGMEVTYLSKSEINEMVGAELTGIGSKPLELLDFGMVKDIEHTREDYMRQKLNSPRSFRENLKMPEFGFEKREIDALITLLVGFTDRDFPARFKRPKQADFYLPEGEFGRILDDVKCLTCHSIKGQGEDFAPDLSFEGSKVQREWLKEFLENPDIIRPLLKQMPRFKLEAQPRMLKGNLKNSEIEIIVRYIENVLISDDIPEQLPEDNRESETLIDEGKVLYNELGCISCHQIGSEGGALGPNLSNVGNRLKPGYIFAHLQDPQRFSKDTIEPNYRLSDPNLIALTQYLLTLKEN